MDPLDLEVSVEVYVDGEGYASIELREVRIVPDVEDEIVAALNALRARFTYVFTTGGIGPTHDDITVDAVAAAFGVPVVVGINHFFADTDAEIETLQNAVRQDFGVEAVVCKHWADGAKGAEGLARAVVDLVGRQKSEFKPLYPDDMPLVEKIRTIAKEIYRARDIAIAKPVRDQLASFEAMGFGKVPVCIAKTQYSFSTNPDAKGAPTDHEVTVREVRLSAGAEFVVAVCGDIMTMPGLPRVPAANSIDIGPDGKIVGLF